MGRPETSNSEETGQPLNENESTSLIEENESTSLIKGNYKDLKKKFDGLITVEDNGEIKINSFDIDMEYVSEIADHCLNYELIAHPAISIYLITLWNQEVKKFYFVTLSLFVIFGIMLLKFIMCKDSSYGKFVGIFLILLLFVGTIFETIQLWKLKLKYLSQFQNYLEIGLIVLTTITLFKKTYEPDKMRIEPLPQGYNLTLWFLVMFAILGELPFLGLHVNMYIVILRTYITHMIPYSFLILGFAACFYSQNLEGQYINEDTTKNITSAISKTFIIFFGEFNTDEIQFEMFPIHYIVIFLLFLLFVPIVLNNLLIGLAVDDMEKNKLKAQIMNNKEMVLTIQNIRCLQRIFKNKPDFEELKISEIIVDSTTCCRFSKFTIKCGSEEERKMNWVLFPKNIRRNIHRQYVYLE